MHLFQIEPVRNTVKREHCVYASIEKREHGSERVSETGQPTHGARQRAHT